MTTQETRQETLLAPWQAGLARVALGKPARFGGLCLYPLLGDDLRSTPYLLLDAALDAGVLTIEEKGAGGTVPELILTNRGRDRVLLLDGEELVGAKQNRIINTSVLVEAGSTLSLPVTCVEAGRWHSQSAQFASGGSHYNARGRQKKVAEVSASLEQSGRASADQSRVWSDIGHKLERMAVPSETNALHAVTERFGADLRDYQAALAAPSAHQVGAAFALGRDLVGLDLFDSAATLSALLPKLVASYSLDALEETATDAPPPVSVVEAWLQTLSQAEARTHPAVGLGEDVRLSTPKFSGAALQFAGAALHLSAFQTVGTGQSQASRPSRLARPAQRRRTE